MPNYNLPSSEKESKNEKKPNRLIHEKSPYLLQHAYNPVDWHPWGDEAFKKARQEDKLVFLSIGYSTCHWCHVMAHESFEDEEVAKKLKEAFIPIKVDREERPDIDSIYMKVCQMMTGQGGWPLTIIMTPDKMPVFAATYLPKKSRIGTAGLIDVLERIRDIWYKDRGQILESANRVLQGLKDMQAMVPGWTLDASTLDEAYHGLSGIFDAQNGGFGFAPKFPTPHNLMFMLRYWQRTKNDQALEMVEATLQSMRRGGIFDHIGFGFHRYSTDAEWFVPHFEKMLYDQALLAMACVEAYQATKNELYSFTAREIIEYVLRDMTSDQGGFYSAEDADSEGEEGKFYLWTADELKEVLDKDEMGLMIRLFDIHADGNFEKGLNILRLRSSLEDAASVLSMSVQDLRDELEKTRLKLFSHREKRIHPLKDDKVLADWNGLMIAALAKAAQALGEKTYEDAARNAADFVLDCLQTPEGRLFHRFKGEPGLQANLDDYAFLVWGLIEIYETNFDAKYLRSAISLTSTMLDHFWDEAHGGFFFSPDDGETLLVRQKEVYDGAVPSGNSVAMLNLLRLSHLAGKPEWEEKANDLANAFSGTVRQQPLGHSMFMSALNFALGPVNEVALVGGLDDENIVDMLAALRSSFLPNKAVIQVSDEIREMVEFTKSMTQLEGKGTAYVCVNYSCEMPTNDTVRMVDLLKSGR